MAEQKNKNVKAPGIDPDRHGASQPLSAGAYAGISLLAFAVGIGLLFFYVYKVPRLVENGIQNSFFYVLLIFWGCAAAAFLMGAMRSYARYSGQHLGNNLQFGGAAVIAALVVWGGFKLVPAAPDRFNLTVRAHSADGTAPLITSGTVDLTLGDRLPSESFGSNGEANFKDVPERFRGADIRALPKVDGYRSAWQTQKVQNDVLDLSLEREPEPVVHLKGTIVPPPKNWSELRVIVEGSSNEGKVDELGRFELPVVGREREVRLRIYAGRKLVYDDLATLPGPVTLKLHNLRSF